MKAFLPALLLLAPLAAPAANPRSVALTIQDSGRAQIAETHDLPPPDSAGWFRVSPLPETLLPTTVNAVPLERGAALEILSQRFSFDLRDGPSLFRAFQGKSVSARKGPESFSGRLASLPDFSSPSPHLLLSGDSQSVRIFPNLLNLDSVEFPARPDLARSPTLLWQISPAAQPPSAVQLHYAADGLDWSASHEAVLDPDGRSISLSSRVLLRNRTVRDFSNARVRLALSDKGRFAPLVPDPADPRALRTPALRYSTDGEQWVPERAAASPAVFAAYDLPAPGSLPPHADVRAGLSFFPPLPVETRFVYDGVRFDRYQRNRRTDWNLGTEFSPAVETRLSFRNESKSHLPPGDFRLLRGSAERALEWIGNDWLPPLAPGQEASLNLGPAVGLSGRRLRTGYAEVVPFKVVDESFEILLDNQTGADQTVAVVEHLYRGDNHEITAATMEHSPDSSPHAIRFVVPVKNGSQKSIAYTVRYTW